MRKLRALACALLFLLPLAAARAEEPTNAEAVGRALDAFAADRSGAPAERLHKLFDLYWEFVMHEFPEFATALGYPGQDGRWTDRSLEANDRRDALLPKGLAALASIDRAALQGDDRVNYDLFKRQLAEGVEQERFPDELLALSQMDGVQQNVPEVLSRMSPSTVAGYEDVLARLHGVTQVVDQNLALLKKGLAAGVTPPRIALRDVPEQVANLFVDPAADPVEKSPMLAAFREFPDSIPAAEQERLRAEAVRVFRGEVEPAFRKLRDYLAQTYVPGSRESIGMSAMPDGQAWYAVNAKASTTTDLSPQRIHEIGLAEVARIRGEMDQVIRQSGFKGSFEEFIRFLRTDPRFFYDKPEDLLAGYRDISKRIDPELVKLFGRLPRLPYGVVPVPAYAEKSQTTAYYNDGSLKAGRPGYFYANTYDLKARPKWEMEALTLHEAVPGHHLQIALAQEMEDVPEFRRYQGYTAFVEGWGLYAESLGPAIGLYQDPYSKFGQLTYEMWRAVRLVVDTGMHALGWSRQQAIDYFKANAPKTEHDITVEIDRYIVWPGQALAYKIGELKIKELRAYAERELGPRFDVRAFHDQVLGRGALPLDVLEGNIKEWVAEAKQAG